MNSFLRWIETQFICPVCLKCGSLQVRSSFFCQFCEKNFIESRLEVFDRSIEENQKLYGVRSFIQWKPDDPDCISLLVYLLKSRFSRAAWEYYAKQIHRALGIREPTLIIPAPGSQPRGQSYHTVYFSRALCAQLPLLHYVDCFSRVKGPAQKELNLEGRSKLRILLNEEFTEQVANARRILLIDDIITTGSTLKSCLSELTRHTKTDCQIDIIALFSREKI